MTTDIEKQNLEAHVELCAERYKQLNEKLETVEAKVSMLEHMMGDIKSILTEMQDRRNNQLITWGLGIITTLGSIIGFLVITYVLK